MTNFKDFIPSFLRKKKINEMEDHSTFIKMYVKVLLSTQKEIDTEINKIVTKTKLYLDKKQLIKELWILRYILFHAWFLKDTPPKDQNELNQSIILIAHCFKDILDKNGKADYMLCLTKGFKEYVSADKLKFNTLEKFESCCMDLVCKRTVKIAFECTKGTLGGELHDFIVELIMIRVKRDKNIFDTGNDTMTNEEIENSKKVIKKALDEAIPSEKDFMDFIDSLSCEKHTIKIGDSLHCSKCKSRMIPYKGSDMAIICPKWYLSGQSIWKRF